jgi:hypothetical protein
MNPRSFQALYCDRWGVSPDRFRNDLLARTVYPHARLLAPLLRLMTGHFQADYEFIDDVAHLERVELFHDAMDSYVGHFSNRGFLRRGLRLRISARRMWRIVSEVLPGTPAAGMAIKLEDQGSVTPFLRRGTGDKAGKDE